MGRLYVVPMQTVAGWVALRRLASCLPGRICEDCAALGSLAQAVRTLREGKESQLSLANLHGERALSRVASPRAAQTPEHAIPPRNECSIQRNGGEVRRRRSCTAPLPARPPSPMLSTLTANASHFARDGSGGNEGGGSYSDQVQAQRSLKSAANVLTSGQKDAELDLLTPYAALPRHISGPTVWDAADYRGEEKRGRWVHTWTAEEVQQLEDASVLWRDSGRELGEIERSTFPLPLSLVTTLLQLRERLVHGVGFYLFKGLPTQRWGTHLSAIAYLGLGSYLGNVNSQNGKGHVLGHVKDLGNDPTQIDKVRIYSTNARQFFHTDSSGGLVGLLCLHKALEGGESDIASSHLLWNELQQTRPDVAETLATPNWYYDRKGEVSEGEKGWVQKPVFWLAKGAPAHQLSCQWDPY